jgi:hypothetical protein
MNQDRGDGFDRLTGDQDDNIDRSYESIVGAGGKRH